MKKRFFLGFVFLMVVGYATFAFAWPTVFPTGTTVYDPERAFNVLPLSTVLAQKENRVLSLLKIPGNII